MALAEEAVWVFIGFIAGLSLGLVGGYLLAQLVLPKPSTVILQKTDSGYIIRES